MRSLAVVPPVLLDMRERRLCFDNRNGLVEDPMAEYRERPMLNVWSEQVCRPISTPLTPFTVEIQSLLVTFRTFSELSVIEC